MNQAIKIIDRLIRETRSCQTGKDFVKKEIQNAMISALQIARNEIYSLPSLDSQWIDVKERKPEFGGEYIICEDIGDGYSEVYTCGFDEVHGFLYHTVGGNDIYPNITHWMPLTLPPKN